MSITLDEAAALAQSHFGIDARAKPLVSERDQNFLLEEAGGARFVLKIANERETIESLELQNDAIRFLAERVPSLEWPLIRSAGRVRLFTRIDGVCLAESKPHGTELLRGLGRALGRMDRALQEFAHPAMERVFHWDLRHAAMARAHLDLLDPTRRPFVELFLTRGENVDWTQLRHSTIHNDANDYNVLVRDGRVIAVLDFGDMVRSATVCDLAVALAYAMLSKPDPIGAAAEVVAGYHEAWPLTEAEAGVLFTLASTRLAMSVCYAAYQSRQAPENEYLNISNRAAWELIEKLSSLPSEWPCARFRHICGFAALPRGPRVVEWLKNADPAPVIEPDPRRASLEVLDLSVSGHDMASAPRGRLAIGRYNEARLAYGGSQYEVPGNDGPERRTIHIGLDLFQESGSPVFAPLEGVVHSFADNAAPNDYGPAILLEHDAGGAPFYTLYGHLSRESLAGLVKGKPVRQGDRIATLGDTGVNGGWPPHLHFQILLDTLGREGEFPGVAAPSARSLWLELCPDPNLLVRIPQDRFPRAARTREDLLASRRIHLGPSLGISYRRPLHIVRGRGSYLYDSEGRQYLDCVNNVAHAGHSHPRVVRAAAGQMRALNTNTRYLHELLVEYLERLAATLPPPLRVVYLTCSGSEANELALRLARAHTGRDEVIVVDAAYHGNTRALVDISPYKFTGPGGRGKPPHVRVVPMPDVYRGPYGGLDAGARYAAHVEEAARSGGTFICESALGCGGQIILPRGYLRNAVAAVRAAGGVSIADEVQTGFGRAGSHFWMFETQGAVPDIVTLGKPIGNGHPMGAVVTTPEIAASFANGMEYFNTFGGNPVSCAVGLAVLDVIRDEGLQSNALSVGEYLLGALRSLAVRHAIIGDVRGHGLFLGLELVRDRTTREPAAEQASHLIERMKDRGILLSTDGPLHNVIKIKPPLVFSRADADRLVENLDVVLAEDYFKALWGRHSCL